MFIWLSENAGTIAVCLVLLAIVTAVVVKIVRDRRRGKSSCGCNCGHCSMGGTCHGQK